jgi:hypothetical protein
VNTVSSDYVRRPPPFILRFVMGVFMYGLFAPALWLVDRLGLTVTLASFMTRRQMRDFAAKNPFKGYTPTSHDVFVATFVKSGTNWMMQIAHQLAFHGEGDFDHIHEVVPWPDTVLMGPMRGYAIPIEDPAVWMASPEQKRVIKTHFGWELVPYSEDARYIMVIRDPKDIFVSSYFFFLKNGMIGPVAPSVDTWLDLFLSDGFFINGSWAVNTAGYWAQRHRNNVLICSFKAMRRDLPGTVRRVADFLDMDASEEVIARVCERSSVDYMKRNDDKFRTWKMIPWGQETHMVRKGAQGGSSELLSVAQQRRIDDYFRSELKRLGSDFPYDEFCDVVS